MINWQKDCSIENDFNNQTWQNFCVSPGLQFSSLISVGGSPKNAGILAMVFSYNSGMGVYVDETVTADGCAPLEMIGYDYALDGGCMLFF